MTNQPAPLPESRRAAGITLVLWCLAAFLGALAVWRPADRYYYVYPFLGMPSHIVALSQKPNLTPKERYQVSLFTFYSRARDLGVVVGLYGLGVGVALGVCHGIERRSGIAVARGVVVSGLLGGLFGILGGVVSQTLFETLHRINLEGSYFKTAAVHVMAFGCTGVGLGLAQGALRLSLGWGLASALGGALGGIVAGLLFVPICGLTFQLANTDHPVPKGSSVRLFWFALAAVLTALGLGRIHLQKSLASKPTV